MGSAVHEGGPEADPLRRELAELWQWVQRLERLAETGLQARGLAHDLGNTLTSLLAGSELALLEGDAEEMRVALESTLRLARQAALRLRAFRRLSGHEASDDDGGTPLVEVVGEAVSLLAYPLRKAEVEIRPRLASTSAVPGRRAELLQVVGTALLAVLRGFDGFKGHLEIRLDDEKGEVVLAIRRGPSTGPTPDDDRWWTAGSGLELTVARRIARALGGRIEVENGAPEAVLALPRIERGHGRAGGRGDPTAFAHHPRRANGSPRRRA